MRKRQDAKYNLTTEKSIYNNINNIARGSCLLLLLITFLAINPVMTSAFAEDDQNINSNEGYGVSSDAEVANTGYDYGSGGSSGAEYANAGYGYSSGEGAGYGGEEDDVASTDAITSTVNISFSPTSAATSISPTTSTGQSAQLNVLATVSVQNSGGYSVYLKGNSINLVGQSNSSNYISGANTAKTYTNMDTNTWGYYAKEGTAVPDTATYKAISVSGNGEKIAENTTKKIFTDTKNIMLSFAAKINDEKPADTYKNTITMSVISSPIQVAIDFGIETMQEMTSTICSNAKDNDKDGQISGQLRDTRDGKYYWVSKLADNKCWMTQNLDLDLSTTTALTSATSDVSANWTPGFNTATAVNSGTVNDASNTETRSWSLGNYRITNPTASSSCGTGKADIAACATASTTNDRFTPYTTPTTANGDANAHYIVGNHYQWNAATAGTGGSITTGQASSSICPKGWKLPESNASTAGTFQGLINAGSIGSDTAKLTGSPYYFVRGGIVYQDSDYFGYAGDYGSYWSSTPSSSGTYAYNLYFFGTSNISPSTNVNRRLGFSVRCLAR